MKTELEEYLKTKEDKNETIDDRLTDLIAHYNPLLKEQK
mgnify:CR=1 FL=1